MFTSCSEMMCISSSVKTLRHSGRVTCKKNDTNHPVITCLAEKGKSVTADGAKVIGLTLWCKCLVRPHIIAFQSC
ncbi:hypothetical protein A6J71_17770 [Enterobacter cancerogenus]|nr:hypothetical protein A6J71_17770 [Enterobacter cancerogenus]